MSEKCDVLIIGSGILGCFAARALSRYCLDIKVLEKREDVCTGITRANTGIIYQGYDQHPGSLKAKLCKKASLAFPSLCKELDVHYRKTGLLMLSFGPKADEVLKKKIEHGKKNGIDDIHIIDSHEVYNLEPALSGGIHHALYSENTYTVNPWDLGIAAFENASANGVDFRFDQEVVSIKRDGSEFIIETQDNSYHAKKLLCCAGFSADSIWEMVNRPVVKILPMAADYLIFDKSIGNIINHIISVEPEEKGEGLTLVPTADGNILAGPTRRSFEGTPDFSTSSSGLEELYEKCDRLVPGLNADLVIRNFGAARPNPYYIEPDGTLSKKSITDFAILEENGFFDLIGVKTPGITCANELGEYIASRIVDSFKISPALNKDFNPFRKGIRRVSELMADTEGLNSLPSEYSEIICRCEHVSKGEILEAIRRGATTIDGIKRRTGAGMGGCQGGYCMEKILHILSETLNIGIYDITKNGSDSEVLK